MDNCMVVSIAIHHCPVVAGDIKRAVNVSLPLMSSIDVPGHLVRGWLQGTGQCELCWIKSDFYGRNKKIGGVEVLGNLQ